MCNETRKAWSGGADLIFKLRSHMSGYGVLALPSIIFRIIRNVGKRPVPYSNSKRPDHPAHNPIWAFFLPWYILHYCVFMSAGNEDPDQTARLRDSFRNFLTAYAVGIIFLLTTHTYDTLKGIYIYGSVSALFYKGTTFVIFRLRFCRPIPFWKVVYS